MIYEYLSIILGIIKIVIYKVLNFKKISFDSIPKINSNFKIAMKKNCKLTIGKNLRCRYNISFRIYNKGTVKIGNNCFFNDGCSINCQKHIQIGNNTICGQNVMFFDHDHDYKNNISDFKTDDIIIGNNVWIGANCIILKGTIIGDNTVIAAGSVVKGKISNNVLLYQERNTHTKIIKEGENEKENIIYNEHK